tara:strand:- start:2215 stop:3402 length:1188 start_codon:yes stop_codon:yes gene_type:complete
MIGQIKAPRLVEICRMKNVSDYAIFTLMLVSSLTIMVGTVIAPSLTGIVQHLEFGYDPSWLITLPSLGVVLFAPFVGKMLNRTGALKLLYFGLLPYGILGVMGAFITNDYLLMLDRFLLGGATVAVQVSITSLIVGYFENEARIKMIAWQGMAIELGGVVFLSLGGVLGEWNWQSPFYIYLLAIICLVLALRTLPEQREKESVSSEEVHGDTKQSSFKVTVIFFGALSAMVLFFVGFVTLPLYLPRVFDFSESTTGYFMAFISVVAILTASQMPKAVSKMGDGNTVSMGFLFFMLGYMVLYFFTSVPLLVLSAIFIGSGFGFTIPLLNHMMIEASSSKSMGKNLGLYSMGVFGGQFASTFISLLGKGENSVFGIAFMLALVISVVLYFIFKKNKA